MQTHKAQSIDCFLNNPIIKHMPGLFFTMNKNSEYLFANENQIAFAGFDSLESFSGKTYADIKSKAAEQHENFIAQDKAILESGSSGTFIAFCCYPNNEWKLLLGEKKPLRIDGDDLIVSHFQDITSLNLSKNIFSFTENLWDKKIALHELSYRVEKAYPQSPLTPRESECFFFLLRGKSTKQIAQCLQISHRTVEQHLVSIKLKENCSTKSELIEKAIDNGYMNILPEIILTNLSSAR